MIIATVFIVVLVAFFAVVGFADAQQNRRNQEFHERSEKEWLATITRRMREQHDKQLLEKWTRP